MKRNYVINYFCGLLAFILLAIGIGLFFTNIQAPKSAEPLEDKELSEIEALEYYTAELLIVDIYAYYGDSTEEASAYFCYALINDKHGNSNAVSFSTRVNDSAFEAVKEYACKEEAQIGDLVITCAVKTQRLTAFADYIDQWYRDAAETYNDMLGALATASVNCEFFSDADAFVDTRKADLKVMLVSSMICTAIGAVFAFATFLVPGIKPHAPQPWLWEQDQAQQKENDYEKAESNE
ncbi:MAG: hypothetical protein IJF74_06925 [Clostridia bacterium]|nr:hypothetical protein [Clostridia bacterium]